jgi:hypoxanthine phosphoribosyltransferase
MAERVEEFLSAERIAARVAELAAEIGRDYAGERPLVVCVLKGAFLFVADLVRAMPVDPEIDFLRVSSYGQATESSGVVEIRKDLETPVSGRHVLLVEDIIDTGLTISFLRRHVELSNPASVRVCTLLDKPSRRKVEIRGDYVGFTIEDRFVVGYGLDFAERYRRLPFIGVLHQS